MEATQTLGPGEEAMANNGEMPSASAADVTVLPLIPICRFFISNADVLTVELPILNAW